MSTRIFVVVTGVNVTLRHTSVFPVTLPPGTVAHAVPVQYCTSKLRSPYAVNVCVLVGSPGAQ
jgi:hypothetical protein